MYDTNPKSVSEWYRLRTNGKITTLTYKNIEKILLMYERIRYIFNGVEIDIDSWPLIPSYMEIEGKSEEEIMEVLKILSIAQNKITTLNCSDIYKEFYNIDIDKIIELRL